MARLDKALELLDELHAQDPSQPHSLEYHRSLAHYTRHLSPSASPPSEALTLAANAQHVHRWKRPRTEYPDGLAGYKMWRTALNKYHADILHQVMRSAGYDDQRDAPLFGRTRDLLLKRTLQRPPLPADTDLLKDPEAHLFEDAICLTFLARDFASFAADYQPSSSTSGDQGPARAGGLEKLGKIVSRTWAKMTVRGRRVAVDELVQTLEPELQRVVVEAVTQCEEAEKEAAVAHSD
ncbi:hypothetical protein JCM8115_006930 [Rhodotorula mucilaginosa]